MVSSDGSRNYEFTDLKENGKSIVVTTANRAEFVDLFVQHALYGSCKIAVDDFISGIKSIISGPGVDMTSDQELESLFCGSANLSEFHRLRQFTTYGSDFSDPNNLIIHWFWVSNSLLFVFYSSKLNVILCIIVARSLLLFHNVYRNRISLRDFLYYSNDNFYNLFLAVIEFRLAEFKV